MGLVREYDRSVAFISNGADDKCGVRKQPIAVVRLLLDKRILSDGDEILIGQTTLLFTEKDFDGRE